MYQPIRFDHRPKQHPDNPKLPLHYGNSYAGMRVYHHRKGPLIEPYLIRALHVLHDSTHMQPRTFVCRYDLHFPSGYPSTNLDMNNVLLQDFWRYLRRELKAASLTHPPWLRYLWAREQVTSNVHHYHLMLLINYDSICTVGDYSPSQGGGYYRKNLSHRVARSWARSIAWPLGEMKGLVHVCMDEAKNNPLTYCLRQDDPATFARVFYAASYLCKAHSKVIGEQGHPFGSSHLLR